MHSMGSHIQAALGRSTNRQTVPNVLIAGKSYALNLPYWYLGCELTECRIGGGDDIEALHNNGELIDKIKNMGGKRMMEIRLRDAWSVNSCIARFHLHQLYIGWGGPLWVGKAASYLVTGHWSGRFGMEALPKEDAYQSNILSYQLSIRFRNFRSFHAPCYERRFQGSCCMPEWWPGRGYQQPTQRVNLHLRRVK